ncbi:MAG: arginyl-tRNA--protein transferase [Chitinophagaceae bacterium]|nr:arginyl-tRNA--protein transferase [Chitinophagaceae bacterium]
MLQDIHIPHSLSGRELDLYLAHGWYRMGPAIFTTQAITLDGIVYPVQWLRINLAKFALTTGLRKLMKRNRRFTVSVRPLEITEEMEEMYSRYYALVDFEASPSVADFMLCGALQAVFDSYVVELRHHEKLIAAGIYDQGEKSIAGIMNFYDPEYARFSPGRYMMLLKALLAAEAGMEFYYPGYIADGLSKFDYKKGIVARSNGNV